MVDQRTSSPRGEDDLVEGLETREESGRISVFSFTLLYNIGFGRYDHAYGHDSYPYWSGRNEVYRSGETQSTDNPITMEPIPPGLTELT